MEGLWVRLLSSLGLVVGLGAAYLGITSSATCTLKPDGFYTCGGERALEIIVPLVVVIFSGAGLLTSFLGPKTPGRATRETLQLADTDK